MSDFLMCFESYLEDDDGLPQMQHAAAPTAAAMPANLRN
jgi:hypothetical protein